MTAAAVVRVSIEVLKWTVIPFISVTRVHVYGNLIPRGSVLSDMYS